MRIWVDVTNSPHVVVLRPVIERWRADGHDVAITARDFAQTLGLLQRYGLDHTAIGHHQGAGLAAKARGLGACSRALAAWARALHEHGAISARDLMRHAAVALSAAKAEGSAGVAFFKPAMQDETRDRTELSADLVSALEQGQFSMRYQPIVDVATGTLHGVEALIRWVHPTRGPVSPSTFVPLAEATGLIVPLGRWILREAVLQLAAWRQEFPDAYPLTLDVNLSADQLADTSLPGEVLSLINQTGIDPTRLVLEITESALMRDVDLAQRRLGQLSATGVRIALDDFGTGYSSLSYLRDLPVTVLKVDKSFVTGIEDPGSAAWQLLSSVVDLGTRLGMSVIAEGIENDPQLDGLRRAGCHLGQGFLWSRPLSAEAVAELLRSGDLVMLGRRPAVGAQRTADPGLG